METSAPSIRPWLRRQYRRACPQTFQRAWGCACLLKLSWSATKQRQGFTFTFWKTGWVMKSEWLSSFLISNQFDVSLARLPDVTLQFGRTTGIKTVIKGYHISGWYDIGTIGIKMMRECCYHSQFQTFYNYGKLFNIQVFSRKCWNTPSRWLWNTPGLVAV